MVLAPCSMWPAERPVTRLAQAAGAEYVLHESAKTDFPFRAARDGEKLELGNVTLTVLHTPGHTPEHISLLVTDRMRGPEPWLLLTGHTRPVGDVRRTGLATDATDGARSLFKSLTRLKSLPEHIAVPPGAFAGSVCGRGLPGNPMFTIGFERRFNEALALQDEAGFVDFMLQNIPPPPPEAAALRARSAGA